MADIDDITDVGQLPFNGGVLPVVVQEESGQVIGLHYITEATLRESLSTRRAVYWSRSRDERWAKGDTSGDTQDLKSAYYDCDGDALLFVVTQNGAGNCHTGNFSCFFRDVPV